MFIKKLTIKTIKSSFFVVVLPTALQCLAKCKRASDLPKDILGISVGMSKDESQKCLQEIVNSERSEDKGEQVWRLKNSSSFMILVVGYDSKNNISYIAGVANGKRHKKTSFYRRG